MSEWELNANPDQYRLSAALNVPPPPIASDPLVTGTTPIEQLLRILGVAANSDDPLDDAAGLDEFADRDAGTAAAAENFTAQDAEASATMAGVAGPDSAMAQQFPQLAMGIAGAISSAIGGVLAPLGQLPQQFTQGASQVLQAGSALFGESGADAAPLDTGIDLGSDDEFGPTADDFGAYSELDGSGGFGAGGFGSGGFGAGSGGSGAWDPAIPDGSGATMPAAVFGPPPVPSAGIYPSAVPQPPAAGTAPAIASPAAGMAGMPLIPPGGTQPAGSEKDAKAEPKRVAVPLVRNGAPVQGRIIPGPVAPVVNLEGQPVATRHESRDFG
jgi:hypothetical protein